MIGNGHGARVGNHLLLKSFSAFTLLSPLHSSSSVTLYHPQKSDQRTMTKPIGSVPTRARQFRILALPLARLPRPTPSAPAAANAASSETKPTPLILYHVSQPDASPESGPPNLSQRALNKASDVWLKLGEKDKKSVSYWFYKKGEGLMDKIEYEEWALKNIQEGRGVKIIKKGEPGTQEKIEVSPMQTDGTFAVEIGG